MVGFVRISDEHLRWTDSSTCGPGPSSPPPEQGDQQPQHEPGEKPHHHSRRAEETILAELAHSDQPLTVAVDPNVRGLRTRTDRYTDRGRHPVVELGADHRDVTERADLDIVEPGPIPLHVHGIVQPFRAGNGRSITGHLQHEVFRDHRIQCGPVLPFHGVHQLDGARQQLLMDGRIGLRQRGRLCQTIRQRESEFGHVRATFRAR